MAKPFDRLKYCGMCCHSLWSKCIQSADYYCQKVHLTEIYGFLILLVLMLFDFHTLDPQYLSDV